MEQTFTIDQIKQYIRSQYSLGDVLYNLSADAIVAANVPIDKTSVAYQEGVEEYQPGKKTNTLPQSTRYIAG